MNNFSKEYILKENFSNKKNLLVLIGHLRTIEYLIKYHKKFLQKTNSDLIISTWRDEHCGSNLINKIKNTLKPIYFEVEDFNFNLTVNIFGNLNKFDLVFGKSALSTRSQVYKIVKLENLILETEKLQSKKYDIIFKSRPDLFLASEISLKLSDAEIIFESTIGDWRKDRSDRFFFAKRSRFLEFIKSLRIYGKKSWDAESMYPIYDTLPLQEQFIKYCCDKGNFITRSILPTLRVWRPKREPEIKDLISININKFLKKIINKKKISN